MILAEDIFCYKKKDGKQVLIAKKGSEVKVVSQSGEVYIVELNNDRFAVNKIKIKE